MSPWVVHCKRDEFDVLITRPSKWGNPFVIGIHGNRQEVINKFKEYLLNNKELLEACKKELKGKVLGCWCSPQACHGDILAEIANNEIDDIFS